MKRFTIAILALLIMPLSGMIGTHQAAAVVAPAALQYLSPPNGGQFVLPGGTVALRLDGPIDTRSLSPALFTITGSDSGRHRGQALLAADGATIVFKPSAPFAAGETVTVAIGPGLKTRTGAVFEGLQSSFSVAAHPADPKLVAAGNGQWQAELESDIPPGASAAPGAPGAVAMHPQDYMTFPHDFPAYTVTVPASNTAPGLLFMAPIPFGAGSSFLFIADDSGEPVYWQAIQPAGFSAFDFKQQPNGLLSYYGTDANFHLLDNTYTEVRKVMAANGYSNPDIHDLQILPNGDALFLIYDSQQIDMSQIISGGVPTATVLGLVIQEVDTSNLPVFQWSSWDHFLITDTYVSLTTPLVDYVHGNAIERDFDGNLLLSSRHLSEITKIARDGHIIWRLGGKNNQFTRHDPNGPFSFQHDIRRLPNGDITMFDNHNPAGPSRALEYQIDESAKVVTTTWEYSNTLGNYAPFTGNNQRLPDGHRFIDWGYSYPNMTEVLTDGTKLFELELATPYFSYRAFRFPWSAVPAWDPTLVLTGSTPTLYYSWNGATDVADYEIYGGWGQTPNILLGTQSRTGFEDHTDLAGVPGAYCSFRVRPVDHEGQPQRFSNVVYSSTPCIGYTGWFPAIFGP